MPGSQRNLERTFISTVPQQMPQPNCKNSAAPASFLLRHPAEKRCRHWSAGLGANGTLLVVGASAEPIEVSPNQLLFGRKRVQGWPGGMPTDSEDTLRFAEMTGVRPMIEKLPLEKAPEAYARMIEGRARFRMVLVVT